MSGGATGEISGWLAGLGHGDVPQMTRLALRRLALDTMGAALSGRARPRGKAPR